MPITNVENDAAGPPDDAAPQVGAAGPATADSRNWQAMERQDWHLWALAMLLMFVLGISLLTFMFPSVFWAREESAVQAPQRAFFGFCLLLALALVYMLQRQSTVRRLRRSLYEAQAAAAAAQQQANIRSFQALPEVGQFHDSLAMEYLRASRSQGHLAVLLLRAAEATPDDLGRISGLLRDILRPGEALFRVSADALGVILPRMGPEGAAAFGTLVQERVSALRAGLSAAVAVRTYPEEVATVAEFEKLLRGTLQGE
jgi:GGDEF domain-containing protein